MRTFNPGIALIAFDKSYVRDFMQAVGPGHLHFIATLAYAAFWLFSRGPSESFQFIEHQGRGAAGHPVECSQG